jgi:hypothetical protein
MGKYRLCGPKSIPETESCVFSGSFHLISYCFDQFC